MAEDAVKIHGMKDLKLSFMNLHDAVSEEEAGKAVYAGAIEVTGYAKEIITEKGAVDTGYLRLSIRPKLISATEMIFDGVKIMAQAVVRTIVRYGPYIEFGTRFMAARPFMRPALDDHVGQVSRVVGYSLKRSIEQRIGGKTA